MAVNVRPPSQRCGGERKKQRKTICAGRISPQYEPESVSDLFCVNSAPPLSLPLFTQAPLTLPSSPALIRLHSYLTTGCSRLPLQLCSRPGIWLYKKKKRGPLVCPLSASQSQNRNRESKLDLMIARVQSFLLVFINPRRGGCRCRCRA